MNAGASPTGQAFAIRNCDAFFLQASRTSLDETAGRVAKAKDQAKQYGRELGVYTVGVITCKPSAKEAKDYYQHCIVAHADWSAVDGILALKNISAQTVPMQEYLTQRSHYAQGMGGLPIVGDPDEVARQLTDLSKAGLNGNGGYHYPKHQTPWQEIQRGMVDQFDQGMVLKPAVKYQHLAQTAGVPRDNH